MSVQQIDESGWTVFFDAFSKMRAGKRAEIEVASLGLGDSRLRKPRPSDPEVAKIYIDYDVGSLIALEVDAYGTRQMVKLKDPLALPTPEQVASREPARRRRCC
jgi:hypothetical protein